MDLNDTAKLKALDTVGMHSSLADLGAQCLQAYQAGQKAPLRTVDDVRAVLVTGLGGSAIGGDLLRIYCQERLGVPVQVNRDYTLPAFVDGKTLVFAVSYSGNTEETLSAYHRAREKGSPVIVLTAGGKLRALADADNIPVIEVPGGLQPRAATGYLFLPMLAVLERLGLLGGVSPEIDELEREMKKHAAVYRIETPVDKNPAKQLAQKFKDRIPVIWGSHGNTEVVAQRWKGQINENAKAPAYWNVFPELNHNEIVGFGNPADLLKKLWVVLLKDKGDHPRVDYRMEVTRRVIADKVGGISEIDSTGSGMLARLYSLIYMGDWTSFYLAALYGIDPGPVKVIDYLKGELAKR
ncbi:MAG: bifunctional phosphoglucose/phosphomannose isomerase [Bacillota bacterium]